MTAHKGLTRLNLHKKYKFHLTAEIPAIESSQHVRQATPEVKLKKLNTVGRFLFRGSV